MQAILSVPDVINGPLQRFVNVKQAGAPRALMCPASMKAVSGRQDAGTFAGGHAGEQ